MMSAWVEGGQSFNFLLNLPISMIMQAMKGEVRYMWEDLIQNTLDSKNEPD